MSRSRVYLDHNASAPLLPAARREMEGLLDAFGNPSAQHTEGRRLATVIDTARSRVADLCGAARGQVVFTGSASEAITQALRGGVSGLGVGRLIVSDGEHRAVRAAAELCGVPVVRIGLGRDGRIDLNGLKEHLARGNADDKTLVCVHWVNNETGVVQPIAEICDMVRDSGHLLFVDGVQGAGKLDLSFERSGIHMMAISAHKLGGPVGVGALLVRESCNGAVLIPGGGQEQGRRGGTRSAMLLAGFGAAAAACRQAFDMERLGGLIGEFEAGLRAMCADLVVFGKLAERLGNVSLFALPGLQNETALIGLDLKGIAVSAGSACSSGKRAQSAVLAGMGVPEKLAQCALRVSVGWNSTRDDIHAVL
ncbi:MAG TPA: aminotransferase class V-fold PLP-dependent enzyme, partial [Devosia sp.]|nr:aminotransferase class V-fold PLP-dependent enzyme [Devosia sp.]